MAEEKEQTEQKEEKAASPEELQKKLDAEKKKLETKRKELDKAQKAFDKQQEAVDAVIIEMPKSDPRESINGYLKAQNRQNRENAKRRQALRDKELSSLEGKDGSKDKK